MLTTQTNKETHCKYSQHNQMHFFLQRVSFFGCVVSICKRVRCKIDESCFLNLQVFFFYLQRVSFFWLCCEHLKHVHCKIEEVVL